MANDSYGDNTTIFALDTLCQMGERRSRPQERFILFTGVDNIPVELSLQLLSLPLRARVWHLLTRGDDTRSSP